MGVVTMGGYPILVPNEITNNNKIRGTYKGFNLREYYISYNDYDTNIYGSDTTALVIETDTKEYFYVLNGDHRKELNNKTLDDCLAYVANNQDKLSKYSEKL